MFTAADIDGAQLARGVGILTAVGLGIALGRASRPAVLDRIKATLLLCQYMLMTSLSRSQRRLTMLPLQHAWFLQGILGVHVPSGRSLVARNPEGTGEKPVKDVPLSASPFPRATHREQRQSQHNNSVRNIVAPKELDSAQRVGASGARRGPSVEPGSHRGEKGERWEGEGRGKLWPRPGGGVSCPRKNPKIRGHEVVLDQESSSHK